MQKFKGTLTVEEIHGRKGVFCVGVLRTSIGEFKVKDAALEQFQRGSYQGEFLVERIYTKGVPWRGGVFTELIAKIAPDGFLIDQESDHPTPQPQVSVPVEPDPADELHADGSNTPEASQQEEHPAALPNDVELANKADEALFGLEIAPIFIGRKSPITLDPTVDRELFRRQRDRLKAAGYKFNSRSQVWELPS